MRLSGSLVTLVVLCLKLLLDEHDVVQLALVLELSDNDRVLFKVIVAKVFHQEEGLSHLPVRCVTCIARGRVSLLKLLVVSVSLAESHVLGQCRRLVTVLNRRRYRLSSWLLENRLGLI